MTSVSAQGIGALAFRPKRSSLSSVKKSWPHGQAYKTKSFPIRLLIVLLAVFLIFFSTAGERRWKQDIGEFPTDYRFMTEKLERKLMGSLPQRQINRACKELSENALHEIPNLVSIKKWHTFKDRPRESVSIVTQLSIDRLTILENQCVTWPDPLVAVVYIPMVGNNSGGPPILPTFLKTSLEDVIRGVESFHQFMEGTAACAFHLELVGQFISPSAFPGPYPINALRNRAIAMSPTDIMIQLDADFVVTPMLGLPGAGYRDPAVFNQMLEMTGRRTAVVLPALELTNKWQDLNLSKNVARNIVMAGKSMARSALSSGSLDTYRPPEGPNAHDATDTARWASMSAPLLYKVSYSRGYEPCIMLSLAAAPWFDERFVDYGSGVEPWFAHLAASNFTFVVHPIGFVVHVPHTRTQPSSQYMEAQQKLRLSRMQSLQQRIEQEIKGGNYEPMVRNCASGIRKNSEQMAPQLLAGAQPAVTRPESFAIGAIEDGPFAVGEAAELHSEDE